MLYLCSQGYTLPSCFKLGIAWEKTEKCFLKSGKKQNKNTKEPITFQTKIHENYNHPSQFIQSHIMISCRSWSFVSSFMKPLVSPLEFCKFLPNSVVWSISYQYSTVLVRVLSMNLSEDETLLQSHQSKIVNAEDFKMPMIKGLMKVHYKVLVKEILVISVTYILR